MLEQAIEMVSNKLTERTVSSRHQREIYVFPVTVKIEVYQKHIAKLVLEHFLLTFLNFYIIFARFNQVEDEWSTMEIPKAMINRYWFILRFYFVQIMFKRV